MNMLKPTIILLAALAVHADAQNKIVLRAADIQPENYPTVVGLKAMADHLRKSTDGRIELQVFAGGQLGDERSTIEQTKLGVIDIVRVSAAPVAQVYKPIGVYNMPFLFRDSQHMWKVLNGKIGKEILGGLQDTGYVGLGYYDSGSRNFYTARKPIKSVEDLKDMRIRVQQNRVALEMMEALGAKPVPLSMGEVYSSLQTGAIDGAENNFPSYGPSGARHYEVAKNFTLSGHSSIPEVILMSKTSWDKLTPADRKLIQRAAAASVPVQRRAWNKLSKQSEDAVRKAGVNIHKVDKTEFQKAMQPVYDRYRGDFGDLIQRILEVK